MIKKITLGLVAVAVVIGGVATFSAFEAHIINVTATIENALSVTPDEIAFGTVFPQEKLYRNLQIALSGSFVDEDRADDVDYIIRQKPKCYNGTTFGVVAEGADGVFYCADEGNYKILPVLCPFLSKHEMTEDGEGENDGNGIAAFHGSIDGWSMSDTLETQVFGRLAKSEGDTQDSWVIDLDVPCFKGMCAQDWDNPGWELDPSLEHAMFGCDLWVEVIGTSREIPLYEETGDDSDELGPIKGSVTYDNQNTGALNGAVIVDAQYLTHGGQDGYLLVLNGPRGASTAPGSTNEKLASAGCSNDPGGWDSPGWDGWWGERGSDNTGATDTNCDGLDDNDGSLFTSEEGYYNFAFHVTAAQLEAGYPFSVSLPVGVYSEVQFLVKNLDAGWATVLEYPGVGETDSSPSEFGFTIE